MERLTQHTPKGASLILHNPKTELDARRQIERQFMVACNRLAAYEDIGLTPDEIIQLNTFVGSQIEKLLAENARLRIKLERVTLEKKAVSHHEAIEGGCET